MLFGEDSEADEHPADFRVILIAEVLRKLKSSRDVVNSFTEVKRLVVQQLHYSILDVQGLLVTSVPSPDMDSKETLSAEPVMGVIWSLDCLAYRDVGLRNSSRIDLIEHPIDDQ
jgi:hypothetical protein